MAFFDRLSVSSDSESDGSFDSGYYSLQQHCLISVSPLPPSVFYVVPAFQLVPLEVERSSLKLPAQSTAVHASSSERRLVKWSLPPPPGRAASLPGWTPMPL